MNQDKVIDSVRLIAIGAVALLLASLTSCSTSKGTYNAHGHCMSERFSGYR
jgi:hypothetical protein